jgi:predicted ester cyclase
MTQEEHRNIGLVQTLYEAVLNQRDLSALPALVGQNVLLHPTEERGPEAYAALIANLHRAFSGQHFALEDLIVTGDRVVVRWVMQAIQSGPLNGIPATGKHVKQTGTVIYRIEAGKIVEMWPEIDRMGMLRQLGIDPLAAVPAGQPQSATA